MTEPDQPRTPITLRRWLLTALAVLVPVVPIVIGLVLSGGSSPASAGTTAAASRFTPAAPPPASGAPSAGTTGAGASPTRSTSTSTSGASTASGTSSTAAGQTAPAQTTASAGSTATAPAAGAPAGSTSAPPATALPAGTGALVALVRHPTRLRATPGGRAMAKLTRHTGFGSPTTALVTKVDGRWLGVITTAAGNNRIGWIRASDVSLSRVDWRVHAMLSRHELMVSHNGRTIRRFTIAVGMPRAPTPTGHFAVTDRLNTGDPTGPYGCCILALSAQAPHAISDWDGGNRIAIHSTPETDSIGKSVSHGCMRLTLAEGRWLLLHIPLGTPVDVST